jgi:TolB-like protein/Tfp pilus assembly protein PilF
MSDPPHALPAGRRSPANGHLDSWGEIATHLHRSVSTVQRWEKHEGLPVHRIAHSKQGSVYATTSELDRWYEARSQDARGPAAVSSAGGRITLAVLPFQNLSASPEQDYFSDGLTEELITHLARLRPDRLAVVARTSAMQYRNTGKDVRSIGAELGVAYVLEGSVRRGGDRVRVSAQLVATSDGIHLWADSYEQPLTDVIEIQTAIAERVGDSLTIHLLSEQHAAHAQARHTRPDALDEFLKGRYFWNMRTPAALGRALGYFQTAIERDPGFAPAYAGLADTHLVLGSCFYGVLSPRVAFPAAKTAAERALGLDPGLAEAYATLGWVQYAYDWDWAGADRSFRRALELNPSYATGRQWYAFCLGVQGRSAEALAEIARARALDPLSLVVNTSVGFMHYLARDYEKAREHCARTLEVNPGFPIARLLLAAVHSFMGHPREALAEHDSYDGLAGVNAFGSTLRACHQALAGDRYAAERCLDDLRQRAASLTVFSWQVAMLHASLGAADEAFAALERTFDERSDVLVFLKVDPHWDPLRTDPRFEAMLRRVGLA